MYLLFNLGYYLSGQTIFISPMSPVVLQINTFFSFNFCPKGCIKNTEYMMFIGAVQICSALIFPLYLLSPKGANSKREFFLWLCIVT